MNITTNNQPCRRRAIYAMRAQEASRLNTIPTVDACEELPKSHVISVPAITKPTIKRGRQKKRK